MYGSEVAAHGSFDDKAYAHSPELWVSQHRGLAATVAVGVAGALLRRARVTR